MRIGGEYVVRVYVDDQTDRIAASARVSRFIHKGAPDLRRGQEVELLVTSSTEPGYNAIIDHRYLGLIHHADAFRRLRRGERLPGYVKRVRGDGRVDLLLRPPGYEAKIDGLTAQVLAYLRAADGPVTITAKSAPSVIYDTFGMSKKNYKKAIGALYKQRLITIEDDAIRLAAAGLDGRET